MPICAVFGCPNYTRKLRRDFTSPQPLTFHKLPKKPDQRKKWIHFCARADKLPSDPRICSIHFEEAEIHNAGLR